jgi:ethanolamine utilization protein EutN
MGVVGLELLGILSDAAAMLLADVVGTVVMTVKHPAYEGEKLMAVQPLNEAFRAVGQVILAIDRAQAGVGDRVLVLREGSGIRQIIGREMGKTTAEAVTMDWPVRSLIVGIVDVVDVDAAALVGAR